MCNQKHQINGSAGQCNGRISRLGKASGMFTLDGMPRGRQFRFDGVSSIGRPSRCSVYLLIGLDTSFEWLWVVGVMFFWYIYERNRFMLACFFMPLTKSVNKSRYWKVV